jgi:hypothetical protein
MAQVFATANRTGNCGANTGNWNGVHDATGGKSHTFTAVSGDGDTAVRSRRFATGFPGGACGLFRVFMEFDTSGITSAPSRLTLNIKGTGTSTSNTDIIILRGNQTTYNGNTFNDFPGNGAGWDNTTAGIVPLSAQHTTWNDSSYNVIELNAAAITAVVDEDVMQVVIMTHDFDYLDVDPSIGQDVSIGMHFNRSGTSEDPYIETFFGYGGDIIGVASTNVEKISGVATANVEKVIGV